MRLPLGVVQRIPTPWKLAPWGAPLRLCSQKPRMLYRHKYT